VNGKESLMAELAPGGNTLITDILPLLAMKKTGLEQAAKAEFVEA
jgi:hypothetical protein